MMVMYDVNMQVEAICCVCSMLMDDGDVQERALRTLHRLPQRLVELLSHCSTIVQHAVVSAASSIMRITPSTRALLALHGCLANVVDLLGSSVAEVQEQAAEALHLLLTLDDDDCNVGGAGEVQGSTLADDAAELGAISSLLDMVTSGSPALMQAAGQCLRMFPQRAVASTGPCLQRLVQLMASPMPELVQGACTTAAYLARDDECQMQLMALRALPLLLHLLASNFLPNRAAALSVLANLLELPECQDQLRTLKGIPLIVSNLAAATAHRHLACLSLRNAAILAPNKAAIKDSGALPMLVALLKEGTETEQEHAAGALWHLSHDAGMKIALRDLGAFAPLVALARGGGRRQQVAALGCIWALAHGNANNKACLRSAGAVTAIAALLKEQVKQRKP